jgi:hypothetical protein
LSAHTSTPMRLASLSCYVICVMLFVLLPDLNVEILEYHSANRPTKNPPRRSGEHWLLKVSLLNVLFADAVFLFLQSLEPMFIINVP